MNMDQSSDSIEKHPPTLNLFTELLELVTYKDGELEWKELARWIKYEELVEEEGDRWSKPHIATISLRGLLYLRKLIRNGSNFFDMDASDLDEICKIINEKLIQDEVIPNSGFGEKLTDILMKKHRHQFEGSRKDQMSFGGIIKDLLVQKLEKKGGAVSKSRRGSVDDPNESGVPLMTEPKENEDTVSTTSLKRNVVNDGKTNTYLMKKLPLNTEAVIVLSGRHKMIQTDKPISIFIRLKKSIFLGDLPEVDIPTKFLYICLLPMDSNVLHNEVGMSVGAAFSDEKFRDELISDEQVKNVEDLMNSLDDFTDGIKALPRSWDSDQYIEPPTSRAKVETDVDNEIDEDRRSREESGLVRTGRFFGGLINDIKRKKKFYLSDFKDAFHSQTISSILFMYFAILAPIVAFGALLGKSTDNRIATIESLVSGLIVGCGFGLFAGQPLVLLGSTGPVYAFEKILYSLCAEQEWDYLSLRLWIGLWIAVFLMLLVAFDASSWVCYITRFTEEIFATLIAFIFIMNSFKNLLAIQEKVQFTPGGPNLEDCSCQSNVSSEFASLVTLDNCVSEYNGTLIGDNCKFTPNVFLMSVILFLGAFTISYGLKLFRSSGYFPTWIRVMFSDFSVVIAILSMTCLDYFCGVDTPKLTVPSEFKPTWSGRSWFLAHALILSDHALKNAWWVDVFLAPILALLATILIFMDQQITAVIINRKDNKLKKGCGYHLDLFVLSILIVILSIFGLPWFVAATVESRNHIMSLTKESKESAPGEKPTHVGVREQRVTTIMIGVLVGASVFLTPVLAFIPMPILYGVFLFMGVRSLGGLQFFDRIMLLFKPRKYHPDYVFLRYVPLSRVHLFTIIQLMSLIGLWVIKSLPQTSISFPVMLVVICGIRVLIQCVFNRREMMVLDDLLPEKTKAKRGERLKPFGSSDIEKSNAEKDMTELDNMSEARKRHRRTTVNEELDGLMNQSRILPNKKQINMDVGTENQKYRSIKDFQSILIFGRRHENEPFTAICVNTSTIEDVIISLKEKFDWLKPLEIAEMWRQNINEFNVKLDNNIINLYLKAHDAYEICVDNLEEDSSKYVVKLIQKDVQTDA